MVSEIAESVDRRFPWTWRLSVIGVRARETRAQLDLRVGRAFLPAKDGADRSAVSEKSRIARLVRGEETRATRARRRSLTSPIP
jgi:hypothetical protein